MGYRNPITLVHYSKHVPYRFKCFVNHCDNIAKFETIDKETNGMIYLCEDCLSVLEEKLDYVNPTNVLWVNDHSFH